MKTIESSATKRTLSIAALAVALAFAGQNAHATFLRGTPYTPTGATFSISAVQAINTSHPTGTSGFHPQVNGDFEFKDSIGVSYDDGTGKLKDFGIGLYQDSAHNTQSTGLMINYNSAVLASSVTITIEDFDIQAGHDAFFKTGKVEPSITLFGPGGSVFASLTPTAIFNAMTVNTTTGTNTDVWDLNFGKVLTAMHLADGPITGFLLSADALNGEQNNSDPYLLVAVGPGIPVCPDCGVTQFPEVTPSWVIFGFIGLVVAFGSRRTLMARMRA